jgi:hypothetical protein
MRCLAIILALAATTAAPVTQPAPRLATDHVALPDLPDAIVVPAHPKLPLSLSDLDGCFMAAPESIGVRLFSAAKSAAILNRVFPKNHSCRAEYDWFALRLCGADAAGLELNEGVVAGFHLYFQHKAAADRIWKDGAAAKAEGWTRYDDRDGFVEIQKSQAVEPALYLFQHPETPDEVKSAMRDRRVIQGMTYEQAQKTLGSPFAVDTLNDATVVTWHDNPMLMYWNIRFVNGIADSVSSQTVEGHMEVVPKGSAP